MKLKVFKIAIKGKNNLDTLLTSKVWGFPSNRGVYKTFAETASVGDKLIFTYKGMPVALGEVNSKPTTDLVVIFNGADKAYSPVFSVKINKTGRISRQVLNKFNITLNRGILNKTDLNTYFKLSDLIQDGEV